jgi:hypothetical protein
MAIHPHLDNLYRLIASDKDAPDGTYYSARFKVQDAEFQVAYQIRLGAKQKDATGISRQLKPMQIPGTKLVLPAVAYIPIRASGFTQEQSNVIQAGTPEFIKELERHSVMCFWDSKDQQYLGAYDIASKVSEMSVSDHDVQGGVWFSRRGVGFAVGDGQNDPALYLSRYVKEFISGYPQTQTWVRENPPPKSQVDSILNWYRRLGTQLINEGWHLLWRGVLYTQDFNSVARDLADLPEEAKKEVSKWAPNTRIDVYRLATGDFRPMAWSALQGLEQQDYVKVLAKVLADNAQEVFLRYRAMIDRMRPNE